MRTFVVGDIHGNYRALKQVLEKVNFDFSNDTLIVLGDVCDGWHETYECVELLLKVKNRIVIEGNHDSWFRHYLQTGQSVAGWLDFGGRETLASYVNNGGIPESHDKFFREMIPFYIDEAGRGFCHAGIDLNKSNKLDENYPSDDLHLQWSRSMWYEAKETMKNPEPIIENPRLFIGHTSDKRGPIFARGVWNIDSGAGWYGKLTLMNVDTEEYVQSDPGNVLYPGMKGRK